MVSKCETVCSNIPVTFHWGRNNWFPHVAGTAAKWSKKRPGQSDDVIDYQSSKMARIKSKTCLKCCENIFAVVVIASCLLTLMTSFLSSPSFTVHSNRRFRLDTLKKARENFKYAMVHLVANKDNKNNSHLKIKPTNSAKTTPETKSVPLIENTGEWFRDRANVKFPANNKKHPVNIEEIISNNAICDKSDVDILIYFQSKWDNFKRRSVLRETWASSKTFKNIVIKTIFILGKPADRKEQLRINSENALHSDIVLGNFTDSFQNLTMKSILALKWINDNCIRAKYIIKADDDMFVNIFTLIEYLISQIHHKKKTIMCHVKEHNSGGNTIIRDSKSKWYVPPNVFKNQTTFPTFCSGYMVLFTSDLVPEFYRYSFELPYFSVDDAYLFGQLAQQVKDIEYIDIQEHMTLNQKAGIEEYSKRDPLTLVAVNAWEDGAVEKLWRYTLDKLTTWAKSQSNIVAMQRNINE